MPAPLPFPAVVTSPAGDHYPMARLRAVGDVVQVFTYERGAVRLAASFTAGDARTESRTRTLIGSADGDWVVEKGAGCGCGHPLKRANLDTVAGATVTS